MATEGFSRVVERLADIITELVNRLSGGLPAALVGGRLDVNIGAGTVSVTEPVSVDDNGASLTVDAATWPLPTGAATAALQLPDSHNVTVDNAAAGAAVNVQDGGNSLTVDGTVTANPATSFGKTVTFVSVNQGAAGTLELAAASVGNNHKLVGGSLVMSATGTLKFTDGVGDVSGPMDIAINGGFVYPTSIMPYLQTAATNRALNLVTTTGAARGFVVILTEA